MNLKDRIRAFFAPEEYFIDQNAISNLQVAPQEAWNYGLFFDSSEKAMKVAAVNACVEIRSDSIGKMPFFVMDGFTHKRQYGHYLDYLLKVRPNADMTPYVFKKLIESWRLMRGNAYVFILRDGKTGRPKELLPLNPDLVTIERFDTGELSYIFHSNGIRYRIKAKDIIHLKAFSEDGIYGQSILSRAAQTVSTAAEQTRYEGTYYTNNASPSGVVTVDTNLGKEAKEKFRKEWERVYGGSENAFKVAVLDNGMTYKPISMSPRDSQFVESKEITVADIARFFLVPLYKLQAGKQTYQSNEQNSIEYVVTALAPTVAQYEEEFTYKALYDGEIRDGLEVRINMNAELRGDTSTRANWYRIMTQIGAYSPNDVRAYEDLPAVEGGDLRIAPLNSIPLEQMGRYFDILMEVRASQVVGGKGETKDEN